MAHGFLAKVFEIFARHRCAVDVVSTSEVSVSLTVDSNEAIPQIAADLEQARLREVFRDAKPSSAWSAKISARLPGVAAQVFDAIRDINVQHDFPGRVGDQPDFRDRRSRCARSRAPAARQVLRRGRSGGVRLNNAHSICWCWDAARRDALVAEVAHERGHRVQSIDAAENPDAAMAHRGAPAATSMWSIDFTSSAGGVGEYRRLACGRSKAMVVGTTGWYGERERVRQAVEKAGTGFVFGANFSYGVNLFFQIVQCCSAGAGSMATADTSPSAITSTRRMRLPAPRWRSSECWSRPPECACDITSEREGDVTGTHTLELASAGDRIVLTHEAKSRRTFAEGAVLAAEWIAGKTRLLRLQRYFCPALNSGAELAIQFQS